MGIGTNTPLTKLQVLVANSATKAASFASTTNGGQEMFFVPNNVTGGYNSMSVAGDQGIFWSDHLGTNNKNAYAGFVIAPWTDAISGIRMDASGNVGIGTNLSSNVGGYKLIVEGKVAAREFVATLATNWPDFVFAKEYKLMPLNELESYVNVNKHLPDVPSAAEISEKGVSLGEMNSTLLQKIEEFSIYIIEQNKKIENLQKEVEVLKNK